MVVEAPLPFANPEIVFGLALTALGPGPVADTATPDPEDFTGQAYRLLRTGGSDDQRYDYPRLEVGAFAQSYDRAVELGEAARTVLHRLGGEAVALHDEGLLVVVSLVATVTPPERIPTAPPGLVYDLAYYRAKLWRPRRLTPQRAAAAINPQPVPAP